jgi:hypothetical protein
MAVIGGLHGFGEVITLITTLRKEDTLTKPAEGGYTGRSLRHMSFRPHPALITNKPADRATLEVLDVMSPKAPEGHPIELDCIILVPFISRPDLCNRRAVLPKGF